MAFCSVPVSGKKLSGKPTLTVLDERRKSARRIARFYRYGVHSRGMGDGQGGKAKYTSGSNQMQIETKVRESNSKP